MLIFIKLKVKIGRIQKKKIELFRKIKIDLKFVFN